MRPILRRDSAVLMVALSSSALSAHSHKQVQCAMLPESLIKHAVYAAHDDVHDTTGCFKHTCCMQCGRALHSRANASIGGRASD